MSELSDTEIDSLPFSRTTKKQVIKAEEHILHILDKRDFSSISSLINYLQSNGCSEICRRTIERILRDLEKRGKIKKYINLNDIRKRIVVKVD
jgi:predicted transcriptional regulator